MPTSGWPTPVHPSPPASASCGAGSTITAASTRPDSLIRGSSSWPFNCRPRGQFAVIQERLNDEPMTDYVTPIGGGYFFVPPGARSNADFVGSGLFIE
jgi:hypothetical protein